MQSYQIAYSQVNHTLNNWCQYCYDITKYRVRRNHRDALLSAEQQAHFRGKLRPADEK